jgi:hypothetical protein
MTAPLKTGLDYRTQLAQALGFPDYPASDVATPYLNYIENKHTGRGTHEEYLDLFRRVVEHFKNVQPAPASGTPGRSTTGQQEQDIPARVGSVQAFLDTFSASDREPIFADTLPDSPARREDVRDMVLYIIGVWTALLSSFVQLPGGYRQVELAYRTRHRVGSKNASGPFEGSLARLIGGSGLLPTPENGGGTQPGDANGLMGLARLLLSFIPSTPSSDNRDETGNVLADQDPKTSPCAYMSSVSESKDDSASSRFHINVGFAPPAHSSSPLLSYESLDSLESLSITSRRLNAHTLKILGGVTVHWTFNLSRHMLLSRRAGQHVLELFALPCMFHARSGTLQAAGISAAFLQEIQESYSILFNSGMRPSTHAKLGKIFHLRKWCWCRSCSAYQTTSKEIKKLAKALSARPESADCIQASEQHSRSTLDPALIALMTNPLHSDWNHDLFPCLWARILALEEHLQAAKPWSIWVLFRDRRDTLQFWTFL